MSTLQELIARVEAAEAGSKELDADIFLALSPDAFGADILRRERDTGNLIWTTGGASFQYPQGGGVSFPIPAVTASLDAAVRLVEEKLPGCGSFIDGTAADLGFDGSIFIAASDKQVKGTAKTPAIALCLALLRALAGDAP